MDALPVNLALLKNPLNYFVVFFMVFLPLVLLMLLHQRMFGDETSS